MSKRPVLSTKTEYRVEDKQGDWWCITAFRPTLNMAKDLALRHRLDRKCETRIVKMSVIETVCEVRRPRR